MTKKAPDGLDFKKVDSLRRHMLLTTADMAEAFGVSRVTYYGWVKGNPIRAKNEERVKDALRKLFSLMKNGWPSPDIIALDSKERSKKLFLAMRKD